MNKQQFDFVHNLLKGKIAEIIFEQMIHNTKGYTVLEFGYEKVVRQLAKERKHQDAKDMIEIIRRAPDFAIVNKDNHNISLVEVKYMKRRTKKFVLEKALDIQEYWHRSCLFVASPDGFFFDRVDDIIESEGKIRPFNHGLIPEADQKKYLGLLNEFIS